MPSRKGPTWRSVTPVLTGSRAAATDALAAEATEETPIVDEDGISRIWVRRRGDAYPCVEELLVAAPATVAAKERAGFATAWARLVTDDQSPLFASA